jgi:hypothetical protein
MEHTIKDFAATEKGKKMAEARNEANRNLGRIGLVKKLIEESLFIIAI